MKKNYKVKDCVNFVKTRKIPASTPAKVNLYKIN